MCNPFHDVIIFPYLIYFKNLNIARTKRAVYVKQKAFLGTFKDFTLVRCKKLGDLSFKSEQKRKVILSFLAELGFSRSS